MGTTGLIFAAIAIAWLAYLVPHFVRRRDDETTEDEVDPTNRFADSMRIVRHGTAPLLDQDLEEIETYEVSTPQTRRAAIDDLRRLESVAALRRRRVLLVLMAGISAVIGVCAVELIPWWSMAIPGGLLVIFVVVARISVRFMTKSLDARYQQIAHGSDESTIFLSVKKPDGARGQEVGSGDQGCGRERVEGRRALGSGADHHADLRVQAAGPAYGAHDRPLRASGGPGEPTPGARYGRRARAREGSRTRRTRPTTIARPPPRSDGKVCVLIGPPAGPWGYGAVGSASRSQREGQGFESP